MLRLDESAGANQLLWTLRTPVAEPSRIEAQSGYGRARGADESALMNAISRRSVWKRTKSLTASNHRVSATDCPPTTDRNPLLPFA